MPTTFSDSDCEAKSTPDAQPITIESMVTVMGWILNLLNNNAHK